MAERSGPHYTKGLYWGKIIQQGFAKSSTGTFQFMIRFTVLGAVNPADPDGDLIATENYARTVYLYLTENAMSMFHEALGRLGVSIQSFNDLDPRNPNHTDLTGKEVGFYCKIDTSGQNGPQEKWNISSGNGGGKVEIKNEADQKDISSLDRMFGAHLRASAKTPAKTKPPVQRGPQPVVAAMEIDSSDVPF